MSIKDQQHHPSYPPNSGLPPLELGSKPLAFFEFWPAWVFYLPVVGYWAYLALRYRSLGLPMLANPNIDFGGMIGESKTAILAMAGEHAKSFILPYVTRNKNTDEPAEQARAALAEAKLLGIELPLVAKPDLGCRGAAVKLVESEHALINYLKGFPNSRAYILQKLAPYQAEAGIFYVRMPGQDRGKITSLTLKYVPVVCGDGVKTLAQLIDSDSRARRLRHLYLPNFGERVSTVLGEGEYQRLAFVGSHSLGSIFRDGNAYITEQMCDAIDGVMQDFPEFHYGRLDIKFANIEALGRGEQFSIIEVNGASSEATHIWDSRTHLRDVFITLLGQYRTLFAIGHQIRRRGASVPSLFAMAKVWLHERRISRQYST